MTQKLEMYAESLIQAVKPGYKPQIVHDEA